MLAAAAAGFQNFAAEHTESPYQLQSLATAGNLFLEQALDATKKAEKMPAAASRQREQFQDLARDFLDQAKQPLQVLLEQCRSKLKSLPKAAQLQKATQKTRPNDSPGQSTRQQLEAKQAEARFLLAKLDFEKSRTYAADSQDQRQTLQAAAEAFAKLYEDYDENLVGFYGRLYQGRSYQAANQVEQALACYWDIVDQPPIANQDFRRLVARAYRYRAECHLTMLAILIRSLRNARSGWMSHAAPNLANPIGWPFRISLPMPTLPKRPALPAATPKSYAPSLDDSIAKSPKTPVSFSVMPKPN